MATKSMRARAPIRYSPVGDALTLRLARAWGCTPDTANQWAWGVTSCFRRSAVAVRVMVEGRDDLALQKALAIIDEAKQLAQPDPLTPELWLAETEADHAEDVRQEALHVIASRAAAEAYVRAIDAQAARSARLRRAIVAHYHLA